MFSESKKYIILMVIALSILTDLAYARVVRDVEDINNTNDVDDQKNLRNARDKGPIAIAGNIVNAIANLVLQPGNHNGNNAEVTPNPESSTSGGDVDKESVDRESCPS